MTKSKSETKAFFETGDKPTEAEFGEFIDSAVFLPQDVSSGNAEAGVIAVSGNTASSVKSAGTFGYAMLAAEATASALGHLGLDSGLEGAGTGAVGLSLLSAGTTASATGHLGIGTIAEHSTFGAALASAATTAAGQAVLGFDEVGAVGLQVLSAETTASANQHLSIGGSIEHSTFGAALASAATTAAGQLVLGAGAVGVNLFESSTTAAAKNALGAGAFGTLFFETATTAAAEAMLPSVGAAGWTLIGTAVAAGDANLTITGLDSTYDTYAIALSDLVPATDGVYAWLRVGDSGGVDSAVSDYGWQMWGDVISADSDATISGDSDTLASEIVLSGRDAASLGNVGNAAGEGIGGFLYLHRPGDGTIPPIITGDTMYLDSAGVTYGVHIIGTRRAVITLDRIQFLFSGGNVATGRLTVWGIAHA